MLKITLKCIIKLKMPLSPFYFSFYLIPEITLLIYVKSFITKFYYSSIALNGENYLKLKYNNLKITLWLLTWIKRNNYKIISN